MSTHASVCLQRKDGKCKGIYVHFDGYPSCTGKILVNCFNTYDKVAELISYGDASSLESTINECEFYCRDRNEEWEDVKPLTVDSFTEFNRSNSQAYDYYFEDGDWFLYQNGEFIKLSFKE